MEPSRYYKRAIAGAIGSLHGMTMAELREVRAALVAVSSDVDGVIAAACPHSALPLETMDGSFCLDCGSLVPRAG